MKKPTHADRVIAELRENGYITNAHAILDMGIWRLGAVIHALKRDGRIELDENLSGFVGKTKNYKYVAKVIQ